MKKILLLFVILASSFSTYSQEQTISARFIVQDAHLNNIDVTEDVVGKKAVLVFYTIKGSEDIFFSNFMDKSNTQSWGRIFDASRETFPETDTEYKQELIKFKWSYQNDYDNKKGTATVKLKKIYKPLGVAFECTIIPEDLDVLALKGYMEGSIKGLE